MTESCLEICLDHEQTKLGGPITETAPGESQPLINLLRNTDCEYLPFPFFQMVDMVSFFTSTSLDINTKFQCKVIAQIRKVFFKF